MLVNSSRVVEQIFLQLFFSVDCGPPPQIANDIVSTRFGTTVGSTAFYLALNWTPIRWGVTPLPAKMMKHGRTHQCVYQVSTITDAHTMHCWLEGVS